MTKKIQSALKLEQRTKKELGAAVYKRWHDADPSRSLPGATSLATYLGKLEKGDAHWWWLPGNEAAREALAEELGGTAPELFGYGSEAQTDPWFPEFPALTLDPTREAPPVLDRITERRETGDGKEKSGPSIWQFATTREAWGKNWIIAPPGSGKSLAVRWARARGIEAHTVERLADALEWAGLDRALVVEVERPDPANDRDAFHELGRLKSVVVLATFALPKRELSPDDLREESTWRARHGWLPDGSVAASAAGWRLWERQWTPLADAPARIFEWVRRRVGRDTGLPRDDTSFPRLVEHLKSHDAQFETAGDLLWLLAAIDRDSVRHVRDLGPGGLLAADVTNRAERLEERNSQAGEWLRTHGYAALIGLARARLCRGDLPLTGPLTKGAWTELLPASLAPRQTLRNELLQDLKRTRNRTASEFDNAVNALIGQVSSPDPQIAVQRLVDAGILRQTSSDGFDVVPVWARKWLLHQVTVEVLGESPEVWGLLMHDPERRAILDLALDRRLQDRDDAGDFVHRCIGVDSGAGACGAIDAVFAAVGRQLLARGAIDVAPDHLEELFWRERAMLATPYSNAWPIPASRQSQRGYWLDLEDHTANLWAWSAYTARPRGIELGGVEQWLTPGWGHVFWLEGPMHLRLPEDQRALDLVKVVIRLRPTWHNIVQMEPVSPVVATGLLLADIAAGNPPADNLPIRDEWIEQWLKEQSVTDQPLYAARLALYFVGKHGSLENYLFAKTGSASLRAAVLGALTATSVVEVVAQRSDLFADFQLRFLGWFGPESHLPIVNALSPSLPQKLLTDGVDWPLIDRAAIERLFIKFPPNAELVGAFWRSSGVAALERMRAAYPADGLANWLAEFAPTQWVEPVLKVIETDVDGPRPAWVAPWALRKLHAFPALVARLWPLALPAFKQNDVTSPG